MAADRQNARYSSRCRDGWLRPQTSSSSRFMRSSSRFQQRQCSAPGSRGFPSPFPDFDIAPQIAQAHGLGQLIIVIHTTLGNVILWVAGVHAAAALFHHFYLRDGVFKSMVPGGIVNDSVLPFWGSGGVAGPTDR